jgi:hypothetical protein
MAQMERKLANRHERRREQYFERRGKSPAEFCATWNVSRSTFEEWKRRGIGPALIQPIKGGRIIISEDAEREWAAKATTLAAAIAG